MLIAAVETEESMERDESGRFIKTSGGLHPKSIGLRLTKDRVEKLQAIAKRQGKTIYEVAREVLNKFLDELPDEEEPEVIPA